MKILVIEDDPVILHEIGEWLVLGNYEALTAPNGQEGIAQANAHLPDMIICDIMMPGITGYEVLRKLQSNTTTAMIPFMFLSALTDKESVRLGMNLGADDYLTKPFTYDELMNTIKARLNKHAVTIKLIEKASRTTPTDNLLPTTMRLTNSTLNGYHFGERLGDGNVYRAMQPALGREIAIKVLPLEGQVNGEFVRRFQVMVGLLTDLHHPNIVPIYDHWCDDRHLYVVMRLLRAGSLAELITNNGKVKIIPTANMLDQIGDALTAVHRLGMIHRNLKPSNILLDERGNAYLTDFSISRNTTSDSMGQNAVNDSQPAHIAYQSPEQIRQEPVTVHSDIYSLGLILYHMLVGKPPFQGTIQEIQYKHLQEMLPNIHIQNPQIPLTIDDVVQKAASKNGQQRYADVRHLAAEFRRATRHAVSAS